VSPILVRVASPLKASRRPSPPMAAGRAQLLFRGCQSIPFAFYRSGTSRGVYVLESSVPPKGPARDIVMAKLMGSGHAQQLEGFGGGTGPTSKAVIVGPHADPDSVTYTFAQCRVGEASVDHSHGDCGNMLAAVGPFALECGLVKMSGGPTTRVNIHSLNTGAVYSADVLTEDGGDGDSGPIVRYDGALEMPGVPSPGAPVTITTHGIAGSQTGKLLPTGNDLDVFDLGEGLGEVSATIVDFARALIMLDAREVLPRFGYPSLQEASKERVEADASLCAALERVRRAASMAMGMGDCAGKDAPKVALLAPHEASDSSDVGDRSIGMLACRYFVNPGRSEMHPTLAMTAAQAIGAACLLKRGVARSALGTRPLLVTDIEGETSAQGSFSISHPQGFLPVDVVAKASSRAPAESFERECLPTSASYATTVRPIASGDAVV